MSDISSALRLETLKAKGYDVNVCAAVEILLILGDED